MSLLTQKQIAEIIEMATQQAEFAEILKLKLDHWNSNQKSTQVEREPSITTREMYQRGYAAAERDLKRELLSDEEINAINLPEKQCTLRELVRLIEKMHGIGGGE